MNDRTSHARGWLAKAESDLAAARRLTEGGGPYDGACFHAQQAAEKALKAVLAAVDAPIPRTHNLEDLLVQAAAAAPQSALARSDLDLTDLTPFAVELRCDMEFWPDRPVAVDAAAKAGRVVDLAASIVRPPSR
jgi:HEPN domain-containing protein